MDKFHPFCLCGLCESQICIKSPSSTNPLRFHMSMFIYNEHLMLGIQSYYSEKIR